MLSSVSLSMHQAVESCPLHVNQRTALCPQPFLTTIFSVQKLQALNGLQTNLTCVIASKRSIVDQSQLIEIQLSAQKGLEAFVFAIDHLGKAIKQEGPYSVEGLPKVILESKDAGKLKKYFSQVHLFFEAKKGSVSLRISGPGGMQPKIPFQDGLALGSIIQGEILEKMNQYVSETKEMDALIQQLESAKRHIIQLETEINSHQENNILKQITQKRIEFENKRIKSITERMTDLLSKHDGEVPIFQGFRQGLESPIDFHKSHTMVQPRAFPSLSFSSQYIHNSTSLSEIQDKLSVSSTSNGVAGKLGWDFLGGSISADFSRAVSNRVARICQKEKTDGVLALNASYTSSFVRSFENIEYDSHKLTTIYKAMTEGTAKDLEKYGITIFNDGTKAILILTEAVLGGSFTGLVTITKQSELERDLAKKQSENIIELGLGGGLKTGLWDVNVGGSSSTQWGSMSENDKASQISNTRIEVEILSQGAIPNFSSATSPVEQVVKHLDLNPANFQLAPEDKAMLNALSNASQSEKDKLIQERRLQLTNAQAATQNVMREIISQKTKHSVHSIESVTSAFENFCKQVITDPNSGIPLGFNYQILTEKQIGKLLERSGNNNNNNLG